MREIRPSGLMGGETAAPRDANEDNYRDDGGALGFGAVGSIGARPMAR